MYCPACGTPMAASLSYCNRCGMNLKERTEPRTGSIAAFLTAITLIGIIGLGIMLGGALTLSKEAHLGEEVVALFMIMTFAMVASIEFLLGRQLSKLTGSSERKTKDVRPPPVMQNELGPAQPRTLPEPLPSVTENTTRTLEYSRREPLK